MVIAACGQEGPLVENEGQMSFFVTSRGPGRGGDLGGLDGADAHCTSLAQAAGSSLTTWRAYLSARIGADTVNARDRIGTGPWFNAKGVRIADSIADLHGDGHRLGLTTSLDERGGVVTGKSHDILTGSNADGTWAGHDATCANWTSRSSADRAMLGHNDTRGGGANPRSWNAAHLSQGCSQPALEATGGEGRVYCFAVSSTATENR
jgi:hypothetical protein